MNAIFPFAAITGALLGAAMCVAALVLIKTDDIRRALKRRQTKHEMIELIGKKCRIEFVADPGRSAWPNNIWPTGGYPYWGVVLAVEMPMIKMQPSHWDEPRWISCSVIASIRIDE